MPTPSEPAESPFANFTDDQLLELKNDLEQRLSRFQRAFFEQHGRNPNEAERAPAKPAIRRYRAVCKELSQREEDHAKQAVRGADTGATGAVAEQGAQQAQVAGLQSQALDVSGRTSAQMNRAATRSRAELEAAREPSERAAEAGAGERAGAAGGAAGGADAATVQELGTSGPPPGGMGGGGGGDMGFGAECASWLPSMSTMEVSVNGLQYIQLTAAMLKEGSRRMLDSIPDFDITVTAPWTINWDEWTGWLSVFNFDFELLSGYADNLRWMKYLPWSTKQFWLTVGVPLIFGLTTVLLIKSLTAIVWLSMMTASILAIVFAVAAKSMLTDGSAIETAYAAQFRRNSGAIPARFRRNYGAIPAQFSHGESLTPQVRRVHRLHHLLGRRRPHHLRRHLRRPLRAHAAGGAAAPRARGRHSLGEARALRRRAGRRAEGRPAGGAAPRERHAQRRPREHLARRRPRRVGR